MRFREEIVEEAQTLLKKIFGVSKKEEVPPVRQLPFVHSEESY